VLAGAALHLTTGGHKRILLAMTKLACGDKNRASVRFCNYGISIFFEPLKLPYFMSVIRTG
jgi:hypothetical protein